MVGVEFGRTVSTGDSHYDPGLKTTVFPPSPHTGVLTQILGMPDHWPTKLMLIFLFQTQEFIKPRFFSETLWPVKGYVVC